MSESQLRELTLAETHAVSGAQPVIRDVPTSTCSYEAGGDCYVWSNPTEQDWIDMIVDNVQTIMAYYGGRGK